MAIVSSYVRLANISSHFILAVTGQAADAQVAWVVGKRTGGVADTRQMGGEAVGGMRKG